MLERRAVRRRRVCLEGAVACGLTGPISTVRLRNLSPRGAEIVLPEGGFASPDVELSVGRADMLRKARVVWRRMDRFGLEFSPAAFPGSEEAAPSPDARKGAPFSLLMDFLSRRRAGRKG